MDEHLARQLIEAVEYAARELREIKTILNQISKK